MKKKHNKKRNTAFLYETLMVELTKSVLSENQERKKLIVSILSECFKNDTELSRDLMFYQSLNETRDMDERTAEKLIFEVKKDRFLNADQRSLFNEQTRLIGMMNKRLTSNVFSNFVPGYKSLATISQIFNQQISPKQRVLLEKELVKQLMAETEKTKKDEIVQIDNLIYKTFATKFNNKYGEKLLDEQKELLSRYIMSFSDNGVSLKFMIGEELHRIQSVIGTSLAKDEVVSDPNMLKATKQVATLAESYKSQPINESMLKKILKMQTLASEIEK